MTAGAFAVRLADPDNAEPASTFSLGAIAVDQAGLYPWWADDDGRRAPSEPFDVQLPSLIYGGQAGATSSRSRTERVATLGVAPTPVPIRLRQLRRELKDGPTTAAVLDL